jgi:hypothetical protein
MHSLLINDLKKSSFREMTEISKEQQKQTLGGTEETTIIFIGPKPPKLTPILSNWPVMAE